MTRTSVRTLALTGPLAALAVGALSAGAAQPAAATTAPAVASSAHSTVGPVKSTRIDVDGDGRADLTTFRQLPTRDGHLRFVLQTTTARGAGATMPVVLTDEGTNITTDDVWVGAAAVDGARGGEIVLDRALAERLSVGVGDFVRVLGGRLRVSGEVEGTAAINGSYSFVAYPTLKRLLGGRAVLSYVFVRGRDGVLQQPEPGERGERVVAAGERQPGRRGRVAPERRVRALADGLTFPTTDAK